ncbi:hypothetical protein EVAR_20437_1 [Eumeta japonica]|uniref:Uncharacterized protein n=1 Tax=Eumeta variegata TaxID=151549 RepID=A0A4C1TXY1_EUMVA|nr:hypothetical protein EVAR_20437_1 [Eumeta japonica]
MSVRCDVGADERHRHRRDSEVRGRRLNMPSGKLRKLRILSQINEWVNLTKVGNLVNLPGSGSSSVASRRKRDRFVLKMDHYRIELHSDKSISFTKTGGHRCPVLEHLPVRCDSCTYKLVPHVSCVR